jgi:hypothetical protein
MHWCWLARRTCRFSQAALDYVRTIPTIVLERVNADIPVDPHGALHHGHLLAFIDLAPRTVWTKFQSAAPCPRVQSPTDGDVLRAIQAAL